MECFRWVKTFSFCSIVPSTKGFHPLVQSSTNCAYHCMPGTAGKAVNKIFTVPINEIFTVDRHKQKLHSCLITDHPKWQESAIIFHLLQDTPLFILVIIFTSQKKKKIYDNSGKMPPILRHSPISEMLKWEKLCLLELRRYGGAYDQIEDHPSVRIREGFPEDWLVSQNVKEE